MSLQHFETESKSYSMILLSAYSSYTATDFKSNVLYNCIELYTTAYQIYIFNLFNSIPNQSSFVVPLIKPTCCTEGIQDSPLASRAVLSPPHKLSLHVPIKLLP